MQENQNPASGLVGSMKELNQDLTALNSSIADVRAEIDSAAGGEERARKQLLKI